MTTPPERPEAPAGPAGPAGPAHDGVLDAERLRADFPVLQQELGGRPLVYLDNAATTQQPRPVLDAVSRYSELDHAAVHRGVHTLSERATRAYETARDKVRRFLGARSRAEIVFVRGATEAINLVAQAFARPRLGPGDRILVTEMEHHSNIVPWQIVCEQTGAVLDVAPIDDRGVLILDALQERLGPRTRLCALAHVSNALGTVNPVRRIVELAHARNVPVLVDGAQAVPHMAVDVQALGCDFYAFSGHKTYAPTGIGALYAQSDLLKSMPPWQGGGEMIRSVRFEHTEYAAPPHRFEAGTPNVAGAVGLGASIDYLAAAGVDRIAAHECRLLEDATARLEQLPGLRVIGTAPDKAAVLSFVVDGVHAHDLGSFLDEQGVAVRTGHHCAMPVMARFSIPGTVRASFALYNTRADVDALVQAVSDAAAALS